MSTVEYPHVEVSPDGIAILSGTRTKVLEVVLDRLAHHWDADEIQRQHPHLSLAQIYAALAYYHDHQAEIDQQIDDRLRIAQEVQSRCGDTSIQLKLRRLGHLP